MSCERYRDALAGAAAGGAHPADLAAHLATCPTCPPLLRRMEEALATVDAALDELGAAEPSPRLEARIRQAVAREAERPARAWTLPGWPVAAAAVLALAIVGWMLARPRGPERTPVTVAGSPGAPPITHAPEPRTAPAPTVVAPVHPSPPALARRTPEPARAPALEAVVVDPRDQQALRRYVAVLKKRSLGPDALLVAGPAAPLAEPQDEKPLELTSPALDSVLPAEF